MLDIHIRLRVSFQKNSLQRLSKAASRLFQGLAPFNAALLRYGSAGLIAIASHWATNDPGPSKLFAEELIKILMRTQ
jgi:hypothetical protein